jgi:hypothetical protein
MPGLKSSLKALEHWLGILGETYRHRWNSVSLSAYRMSLDDLSEADVERASRRVLQTWTLATMPPPGFIRQCADESADRERAQYLGVPQLVYPEISQEERDEILADPEYQRLKREALAAQARTVQRLKLPRVSGLDGLVLATNERLDELERQKREILARFGKTA